MNIVMTIKDVAKEAKVSVATVSRVINCKPNVNDEMRIRVEQAIEKLGFKPNQLAKGLKNDVTNILGIVVSDISNSFFNGVIHQIEKSFKNDGYSLLMASTDGNPQKEKECIEMMDAKRVDGLVICPVCEDIEMIIRNVSCPIVSFDRNTLSHVCDTVYVNKERSMYNAVTYLFQRGHRDIALISGNKSISTNFDRYNGYMRAHYDWDVIARKENMHFGTFSKEYGKQAFEKIINQGNKTTAIISGSADLTEGILAKAKELSVKIPDDISLISFGTLRFQDVIEPQITYEDEMHAAIGNTIGEMMFTRLKNPELPARLKILESKIVDGNSVKDLTNQI